MHETTPRPAMPDAPEGSASAPHGNAGTGDMNPPPRMHDVPTLRFAVFPRWRSLTGKAAFPFGLPKRRAREVERVPLADALTRRWDDDRHVVLYTSDTPNQINNTTINHIHTKIPLLTLNINNHHTQPK